MQQQKRSPASLAHLRGRPWPDIERMNFSQPTALRRIDALEAEFSVPLFQRGGGCN
jgi:hypothetical protein